MVRKSGPGRAVSWKLSETRVIKTSGKLTMKRTVNADREWNDVEYVEGIYSFERDIDVDVRWNEGSI